MSRLFSIDTQEQLNALYILVLLRLLNSSEWSELGTAFFLYRNPMLLSHIMPSEHSRSLKDSLPPHEIQNLTANMAAYSPATLDRAFEGGMNYLLRLGLVQQDITPSGGLMCKPTESAHKLEISERIMVRAEAVTRFVQGTKSNRKLQAMIKEALGRNG